MSSQTPAAYNTLTNARTIFESLLKDPKLPIPPEIRSLSSQITLIGDNPIPKIPTPWRETEAITALKALEASIAIAIGKERFGIVQDATIDVNHAASFLFMSYLSTIDGFGKWDKESVGRLKPTDLFQAQSNLYRRLSANMYRTKDPNVYYHTHGSLEATPILNFLGLLGYDESLTDYNEICKVIENQCRKFSAEELDRGTEELKQAGAIVSQPNNFLKLSKARQSKTAQYSAWNKSNPHHRRYHSSQYPSTQKQEKRKKPQLLSGIKVLDLTRVIAGPVISRTLAEYGASVLKITSPSLPDVPYYQLDLNFGKHTAELDLRNNEDRKVFEGLLEDVDVIVDGYRVGALERLGYGVADLVERFKGREKGFVYVAENCFGFEGPWRERSGWQPVADAVSGLAWGHGKALGLDEPVLPPFPLSDYGTGELGAIAALTGIYNRATKGGSYFTGVSLTQYNLWVQSLGPYRDLIWSQMLQEHSQDEEFRAQNHLSNFDIVSKAAIKSMKRLHPELFDGRFMFEMYAEGFKGVVKSCKPVVKLSDTWNGWRETTRPNGWDKPAWWD